MMPFNIPLNRSGNMLNVNSHEANSASSRIDSIDVYKFIIYSSKEYWSMITKRIKIVETWQIVS